MAKIVEKVKNFFSTKIILKPKSCAKKEEPKPENPEAEQKPEEQK